MKDSGRLHRRQQRFRRHMAGEQRSELQSQTIITHSIDAVSESQRRDLQSHHNGCKRSELQPYCVRTVYRRDGHGICAARGRMVGLSPIQDKLLWKSAQNFKRIGVHYLLLPVIF